MLQNGRFLFKNLYNEELDESVSSRGDLVVLDRGYEELIEWLLEHGFHFLHTQKRIHKFPMVFGLKKGQKLGDRLLIAEKGAMAAYWMSRTEKHGSRTVIRFALAFRNGTGFVALLQTTVERFGPRFWSMIPESQRYYQY